MALINCPYCGNQISDKAESCVHCGKLLIKGKGMRHCPECGSVLTEQDKTCPKCGCPVDEGDTGESSIKNEKTTVNESNNDKKKFVLPVVAVIVLILLVVLLTGKKTDSISNSNSTETHNQQIQKQADSFEERAIMQFCSNWEFSKVTYVDNDGKTQTMDRSSFDYASLPTFNAYNDKTYHFRLTKSQTNDGEWSVVSEEICNGMNDTEYAYQLSTDENSPNKDNIVVMAFINTEDVDADGNAREMSIGYTVDNVPRIVYVFTK